MNARGRAVIPLLAIAIAVIAGFVVNRYAATEAQDVAPVGTEVPLRDIGGRDVGVVTLADTPEGLSLTVSVSELKPGDHGIHLHEAGLCDPSGESPFASAGAHFNPAMMVHGGTPVAGVPIAEQQRHAGDLGNLTTDSAGIAVSSFTLPEITLADGPTTLADADGTALVIHEDPDDLITDPDGNSGSRLACAVIAAPQATAATPAGSPAADTDETAPPADIASPAASPEASPAADTGTGAAATEVTVTAIDISFVEKELSIAADTDTRFVITNEGAAAHNFSIDELGVSVDIAPGESVEVTINAPAGTYQYYCNVPGHAAAGQVGTLTVQ